MKKTLLYTILPSICTLLTLLCAGQLNYHVENITEASGLSDNRITCFLKDRTGFMWIGTENGLNRYDGHSFVVYKPGQAQHTISNPSVNDIEQDAGGRLWVATQNGLNVIDLSTDSTQVFLPDTDAFRQKAASIASNWIWDIYIDPKGRAWLAPDNRDLSYYDTATRTFHYLPWKNFVREHFPHRARLYNSIRKIYRKSDDELWLGTSAGLFSVHMTSGVFSYHSSYETDHFIALQAAPDNHTIYFLQEPGKKMQELDLPTGQRRDIHLNTSHLSASPAQPAQLRWFPAGESVLQLNTSNGQTALLSHITDDPYSLPKGNVRTAFTDNTGLVWIGTDKGVGKFNPAMHVFSFSPVLSAFKNEVIENDLFRTLHTIHTVFDSEIDNKYYISSPRNHALYIVDKTTGIRETIKAIGGIPPTRCSMIYEDKQGMLWILASPRLFQYDRLQKKFSVFPFRPQSDSTLFTDMAEDTAGNIWFACFNDGLYCYNRINKTVWKPSVKDGFGGKLPTSLYFDSARNTLWIGSFDIGLYSVNVATRTFKVFLSDSHNPRDIHASLINDITKDPQGNIWIATYGGGLAKYTYDQKAGQEFENLTTENGLPENNIYSLQTDHNGNIWATTYKGISCIDANNKQVRNFDRQAGLSFVDFYSPISTTRNGWLLTGIENGFVRFHPDSIHYTTTAFNVVITSCHSNNQDLLAGLHNNQPVELSSAYSEIEFSFAALTYQLPSGASYEYTMEGNHANWVRSGNSTIARYNNLGPGHYTFKVRATDHTGHRSANTAIFSFRILPPWWQTWWFRITATAITLCALVLLFRNRLQAIKKKAAIRQQVTELKNQVLRAQINPHFIFNSLNAIQELIVTENHQASYQYLSKFSKLLRQVLDHADKTFIALKDEISIAELYLELESLRFKKSFTYSIVVDKAIDTENVEFPSLMLQPFIENAIWHGLMNKDGDKQLNISFALHNSTIECIIEDNGVGREKAAQIRKGKLGTQFFTSKGTRLSQQRIDLLKEMTSMHAAIVISDLRDAQGHATGTRVILQIPLQYQL